MLPTAIPLGATMTFDKTTPLKETTVSLNNSHITNTSFQQTLRTTTTSPTHRGKSEAHHGLRPPQILSYHDDSVVLSWIDSGQGYAASYVKAHPNLKWQLALQCDMGKGE